MTLLLKSIHATFGNVRAEYSWVKPHEAETVTKGHQIGVSFTAHRNLVGFLDGRQLPGDPPAGAIYVTTEAPIAWNRVLEPSEVIELYPQQHIVTAALRERNVAAATLRPLAGHCDPCIVSIASLFRKAIVQGESMCPLAADMLGHRLVERWIDASAPGLLSSPTGALDGKRLGKVIDFIEASLDRPINLAALSSVSHLSAFHFSRAFKRATGVPPHRYVMIRRLERARHLLACSKTPVNDIAVSLQFQNTSHFRRHFKAWFGHTPAAYRPETRRAPWS